MKMLDEYLKADSLCDKDSKLIKDKAQEITKDVKDEKEAAIAIFYFVRDNIKFTLTPFGKKASQILIEKKGFCVSCANLQVALLRAVNIPARFHIAQAKKQVFRDIFPNLIYLMLPPGLSPHAWCEVYLNNKWLSAESVYDKPLYEGMLKRGIITKKQIPTIDWDGENDLLVQSQSFWIRKDFGRSNKLKRNLLLESVSNLVPFFLINYKLEMIRS